MLCSASKFGWERPNWFAPKGTPQEDHWSFRRSKWFEHVGNECRNVTPRTSVILDMTAFAKCRVSGPGAEAFLDQFVANRIPEENQAVSRSRMRWRRPAVSIPNSRSCTKARRASIWSPQVSISASIMIGSRSICRTDGSRAVRKLDQFHGRAGRLLGRKSRELMQRVSRNDFS